MRSTQTNTILIRFLEDERTHCLQLAQRSHALGLIRLARESLDHATEIGGLIDQLDRNMNIERRVAQNASAQTKLQSR
jgi:hypothetical protein